MNRAHLLEVIVIGTALLVVATVALIGRTRRDLRHAARLQLIREQSSAQQPEPEPEKGEGPLGERLLSAFGHAILASGILPARTLSELSHTLRIAGLRGKQGLSIFVGAKVLFMFGLPPAAWAVAGYMHTSGNMRFLLTGAALVVGLLLPDFVVRQKRKTYLRNVSVGLPDALDMMVICSDAGLGLEPTITRVASELEHSHPDMSAELALTAHELRINPDARAALFEMGGRTKIDGLQRLGATLAQTLQYGTPLSQALRTLSAELRQEMLHAFEARAAKLPVILTVPMIIFILPCVFIVVAGPAALGVITMLAHH